MKTIFITGSTDGIGKLAATTLAKEGHRVLLHGRNVAKLEQVISEIKDSSSNDGIRGFCADLSDFNSVRLLTEQISEEIPRIDVLINNAGVFKSRTKTDPDGLDLRFTVNFLAPFLLTYGLLPLLSKGSSPRVINLSSAAQAPVSIAALKGQEHISEQESYAQSKLALTMWSLHLSREFEHLNVIAVNPGSLLNTRMVQEAYGHSWSSAEKGANILHELAILDEYDSASGKYFDNDKGNFGEPHRDVHNKGLISQLISATHEILGLQTP